MMKKSWPPFLTVLTQNMSNTLILSKTCFTKRIVIKSGRVIRSIGVFHIQVRVSAIIRHVSKLNVCSLFYNSLMVNAFTICEKICLNIAPLGCTSARGTLTIN